jgi:isoleucyl-tRNA synthetase
MAEENQTQKSKIAEREERILAFWQKDNTFKRTLAKKSRKGEFIFYDGPPFASGLPHYGHIIGGTLKDVIPRFKTMQGYHVPRRWGWDCHGLPVENEVEKELGFKSKKDIENYGIEKFNAKAREAVMRYADEWRRIMPRTGRWVDMENDYRTMDTDYTESVWWSFKTLFDKGLIYEGFKSMHLCPRCETTLSNFEVTQGYKELTDTSVYVKFALEGRANTYAIAWTTTPWTLPGNAALAVHPEREYALLTITASNAPDFPTGNTYILGAKEEILRKVFGGGEGSDFQFDPVSKVGTFTWKGQAVSFEAKKGVFGKALVGQAYLPLFDFYNGFVFKDTHGASQNGNGWRIHAGEFVTEEDGTGIVHIAPAFGEDDYALAVREKIPFIQHVGMDGALKKEISGLAGVQAKPKGNPKETDEKIAALLSSRGSLLRAEPYTHEYPHCWRCDTPLLNYAAPSWFVKVTKLREKIIEESKSIRWIPKEVGTYRFGNWLADAKDWAISRARFWGAPIPAWKCERCRSVRVVGSLDELRALTVERVTKVIFLRHGESVKNRKHILDDSPAGSPLTHLGKTEAKEAAERIAKMGGVAAVYTSPIERAKETAHLIASHFKKAVTVEEGFREVDSGGWDGKRDDDASTKETKDAYYALPLEARQNAKRGTTGESWADVEARMLEAFQRVVAKHRGESVLIVSHEGPIVELIRSLRGLSLSDTDRCYHELEFTSYAEPILLSIDEKTGKAIDVHRPYIDDIRITCEACQKETGTGRELMCRVADVFDCWYESGSMPYAQVHHPFEYDNRFDPTSGWFRKSKGFPADFIAEGLDQTRGWFYSLLVLGAGLFEKSPYRSCIVNGIILAENGAKMSKRLKNYPDPLEIIGKYGADALRYYLLSSPSVRGEELRFSERGVDEVTKKVFNRLDNVLQFYLLYAPSLHATRYTLHASRNVLDVWISVRLNQLISEVTRSLENYELDKAARPIGDFIDDLSTWYLRRSRERIKSDALEEKAPALATLRFVLSELAKLMAPFTPFFAEYLFQSVHNTNITNGDTNTTNAKSVHLEDWPRAGKVGEKILKEMEEVRTIVSLGLEARAKANIKVRQPLGKLKVKSFKFEVHTELKNLIRDEVNVKEVVLDTAIQSKVELDTALTAGLKEEGQFRELVRTVQEMRKSLGLSPSDEALLEVRAEGLSVRFLEQYGQELSSIAHLKNISHVAVLSQSDVPSLNQSFQADEVVLELRLSKE